jgi:rSAM/selenodomain-associated transferase 1
MKPVIIIFAKAPIPGRVKTRLMPEFPPEAACRLHEAFVADTLEHVSELSAADIELHTDQPTGAWPCSAVRQLQAEGDLGHKIFFALDAALAAGRPLAMVVGSDSPTLPVEFLAELLNSAADASLGPTSDGGFYAIACRRVRPAMFEGVTWSSPETLAQTVRALGNSGLTVALGSSWYDVDSPADLARLRADPALRNATRAVLTAYLASSPQAPATGFR